MDWNHGMYVIFLTFLVLNLFYAYNFNLYPHIVYNVINILKFIRLPESFIDSLVVYIKTCNNDQLELPQVICNSMHFPVVIEQSSLPILGIELCQLIVLVFRYTLVCMRMLSNQKVNKEVKDQSTNERFTKFKQIYRVMVFILLSNSLFYTY